MSLRISFIAALISCAPLFGFGAELESVFTRWPYPGGKILTESKTKRWSVPTARMELVRCLGRSGFDSRLVIALGCVGDRSDIDFIRTMEAESLSALAETKREASIITYETRRITEATLWATARLGDAGSLQLVASRLSPPDPKDPKFKGVNRWKDYQDEMRMAAYIGDPALLPAIYPSLVSNTKPPRFECFWFDAPPWTAVDTLKRMIPKDEQPENANDPNAWIQWYRDKGIISE